MRGTRPQTCQAGHNKSQGLGEGGAARERGGRSLRSFEISLVAYIMGAGLIAAESYKAPLVPHPQRTRP